MHVCVWGDRHDDAWRAVQFSLSCFVAFIAISAWQMSFKLVGRVVRSLSAVSRFESIA